MKKIYLFIVITVSLFSCLKKESETYPLISSVENYTSVASNNVWEYAVDSTFYNYVKKTTTINSYFVQDSVIAPYYDNLNRPGYQVLRSWRKVDSLPWSILYSYYITPTSSQYITDIQNTKYINLISPLYVGKKWAGNDLNNIDWGLDIIVTTDWNYVCKKIAPYSNTFSINTDSAIYVTQADKYIGDTTNYSFSGASIINYEEVYGKNIGLVFKREKAWKADVNGIKNGYELTYTLKSYK